MVHRLTHIGLLGLALGVGYLWGNSHTDISQVALAQEDAAEGPSEEAQRKIEAAYDALKVALDGLKAESLYTPATSGMNVYAVLSGGVNAIEDLESGRGVDPETFAALYADLATDEVRPHLSTDADGRLTYKNKLVRIYPVSRLKRQNNKRLVLTGEIQPTAQDN